MGPSSHFDVGTSLPFAGAGATSTTAISAAANREHGETKGTAAATLEGESEHGRQKQQMGLPSLSDARVDLPSASADIDKVLRGKLDVTVEHAARASLRLDRSISSAAEGSDAGGISHTKNGGASVFEHVGDQRENTQEGKAFSLSPSELLSATLEEFSAAVREFSDASKAWLEEVSCFLALIFKKY